MIEIVEQWGSQTPADTAAVCAQIKKAESLKRPVFWLKIKMSFDVWTPHKGLALGKVRVKNTRIVKLLKKKIVWRDKSWIQSVLIQHDWSGHRPCDGAERSMNKDCHYSCMYMLCVCSQTYLLLLNNLISRLEDRCVLHYDAFSHFLHFFQQLCAIPAIDYET